MQMAQPDTSLHATGVADDTRGVLVRDRASEDCNPLACRLWGNEFSGLIGKTLLELSPEAQPDGTLSRKHLTARIQAAQSGLPQAFEWQFRRADGELVNTLVSLESMEMEGHRRLVCRVRDLSTLQQAESALRESETRLQQILNNTTAMVYVKDRDGHYLLANRQFERQFHIREAEILGRRDYDVFPREIAETFRRNDLQVLVTAKALEFEETALLADGEHTYLSSKFPLFNTEGEVYAICGISTDITERKRIEEALRNVALGVSGVIGSDIFKEIVRYLTMALGVDCAFIGKLIEGPSECIHTLAVYDRGKLQENIEYDLKGTPCENVVGKQFEYFPNGVLVDFPGDPLLQELHFDSYAAYPLFDSQGGALGLITVMDRKPLRDRDLTEAMLKIFSVRAAAELRPLGAYLQGEAEAAFSVERDWQGMGFGTELMGRVIRSARNRGIRRLYMNCLAENRKMQHIARKYEAELKFEEGEVLAELLPAAPNYFSIWRETLENEYGFVMAVLDLQRRFRPESPDAG
jgi:PAS domain S-box-containing protein